MATQPITSQASAALLEKRDALTTALVERECSPDSTSSSSAARIDHARSREQAEEQVSFLAQALALNSPVVFSDYVSWAKVVCAQRNVPAEDLASDLARLAAVLCETLPLELGIVAADFVQGAVRELPAMRDDPSSVIEPGAPLSALAHQYIESLLRGERHVSSALVLAAVASGTPVKDIYLHVFQPAQYEIGRLWQTNRITIAQEHYCTAATQLVMSQLYPHVFASTKNGHTLVATSVSGDMHEIGVRMVADFFEMAGWNTHYLGANTPHASVIATLVDQRAEVLAISATISTHVDAVRELITVVREFAGTKHVRILVGGYSFNRDPGLWRQVGADAGARDAQEAIDVAERLVEAGQP